MKRLGAKEIKRIHPRCKGYEDDSDDYWRCHIREVPLSVQHPVSTCKMGKVTDETAVVDPKLRYHICPIKRALRRGNDRLCVYLLVKNDNMSFTSKNSILPTVDKLDPRSCPIHSP